jgi:LAO/AO transport system kinase
LGVEASRLSEGLKAGDRGSIARCITMAEDDPKAFSKVIKGLYDPKKIPHVIGITGPPGCGKSTLISQLAPIIAASGHKLAIIAIDASSPFSGGAFLGNRIRMEDTLSSSSIFMRSIATRGAKGGLTASVMNALITLSCAGFDLVIVESVGSGQADFDILNISSTILLVLAPGLGDEIQAMKAGTMEIADIFVINKSELPGADQAKRSIMAYLSSQQGKNTKKVTTTSCVSKHGIKELADLTLEHENGVDTAAFISKAFGTEVDRIAKELMSKSIDKLTQGNAASIAKMLDEGVDPYSAALELLQKLEK